MLHDYSVYSSFARDNFLSKSVMENHAFGSSSNSFSYSSGLEFNAFRLTGTGSSYTSSTMSAVGNHPTHEQHTTPITSNQNLFTNTFRNTDKLYGTQRISNINGLSPSTNNSNNSSNSRVGMWLIDSFEKGDIFSFRVISVGSTKSIS